MSDRIFLSAPDIGDDEMHFVQQAFDTNWIGPLGPNVAGFEDEFCEIVGASHAAAVNSGTAALHLALILAGVQRDDEVLVSSFTFAASANPIVYLGARPVFIDSERASWNMDPNLLAADLHERAQQGRLPRAVVVVDIYGQCADLDPIRRSCLQYEVPLIEDAAEALGATYRGQSAGTLGDMGVFSFNGNKILTCSSGGMLITEDAAVVEHARKLATQARDDVPFYQHSEIGYNYRLSNILAGVGRGQLRVLDDRVEARRNNFTYYKEHLSELDGLEFMPEADWGRSNRWLTCVLVDADTFGCDPDQIRRALSEKNIEARRVWKPLHTQPIFKDAEAVGGDVSEDLFSRGLALPSGSALTEGQLARVVEAIRQLYQQ